MQKFRVMFYNILTSEVMDFNNVYDYYDKLKTDEEYGYLEWESRKWDLIKKINDYNADIIILVEVSKNVALKFFEDELSKEGYKLSFYKEKNVYPAFGCAIFYRNSYEKLYSGYYKLNKIENSKFNNHVSNILHSRFSFEGKEIDVFGCHISWVKVKNQTSKDPVEFPAYKQLKDLFLNSGEIDIENKNVVICGDFNTKPGSSLEYLFKNELGFKDVHEDDPYDTCNIGDNGVTKVDYMYVKKRIKSVAVNNEPKIYENTPMPSLDLGIPSDHLLLCGDIFIGD